MNDIANMTPAQRRNNIMQDLLISSPNERKIPVLYEDFFISDNLIRLDIKLMEKAMAKMNLKLIRNGQLLKIWTIIKFNKMQTKKHLPFFDKNDRCFIEFIYLIISNLCK